MHMKQWSSSWATHLKRPLLSVGTSPPAFVAKEKGVGTARQVSGGGARSTVLSVQAKQGMATSDRHTHLKLMLFLILPRQSLCVRHVDEIAHRIRSGKRGGVSSTSPQTTEQRHDDGAPLECLDDIRIQS